MPPQNLPTVPIAPMGSFTAASHAALSLSLFLSLSLTLSFFRRERCSARSTPAARPQLVVTRWTARRAWRKKTPLNLGGFFGQEWRAAPAAATLTQLTQPGALRNRLDRSTSRGGGLVGVGTVEARARGRVNTRCQGVHPCRGGAGRCGGASHRPTPTAPHPHTPTPQRLPLASPPHHLPITSPSPTCSGKANPRPSTLGSATSAV